MPSTYTLNNGIELIATGEQSGTWGDTTNVNLGLIDTALDGQVTITLASAGSSGSPNTLPISDGSASNGRNRLVIFADGGDLGATAFVQLTPNDAEKIVYIRNDLSGGRSIALFQGTYNASNDYEVPAGTTAVVFFNGGGAGAVAANVFNNAFFDSLRLGGVSVTAILDEDNMASDSATALATQQSIKAYVDAQVTAQDLDFAGDSGTGAVDLDSQTFTIAGTANEIETAASGQTITVGLPNAVTIASLTATTADINGGTIDGTVIGGSTPAAISGTTGTFSGNLIVDTSTLFVDAASNEVGIGTASPGRILHIDSGATNNTYARFTNSNGGSVAEVGLFQSGATGGHLVNSVTGTGNYITWSTSANERMRIADNGDIFFYEDTGTTPKLFWDASAESLSLGAPEAQGQFGIHNSGAALALLRDTSDASRGLRLSSGTTGNPALIDTNSASKLLAFGVNGTERMRIDGSGNVGVGTSSPAGKLHLSGTFGTTQTSGIRFDGLGQTTNNLAPIAFYTQSSNWGTQHAANIAAGNADGTDGGAYLRFSTSPDGNTAPAERMRITSGGEVYIAGTADQGAYNLQVNGTGVWGAGAYVNGSDERLKEDIADLAPASELVSQLRPVTFRYKSNYSKDQSIQAGFIAQELQAVLANEAYVDGVVQAGPQHLNVAYQALIPVLTKALQEALTEIADLKARVAALEA